MVMRRLKQICKRNLMILKVGLFATRGFPTLFEIAKLDFVFSITSRLRVPKTTPHANSGNGRKIFYPRFRNVRYFKTLPVDTSKKMFTLQAYFVLWGRTDEACQELEL